MIPFVGLTGGIASGKSTASARFVGLGVPVVDADDAGHTLYEAGGKAVRFIRREFGPEFVLPDGSVDRSLLRSAVFRDARLRRRLEAIMHPLIRKECLMQMGQAKGIYGVLVAPLMFESKFLLDSLERVLVIDCDVKAQLEHGVSRGIFTEAQLKAAVKAQMKRADRVRCADDVIVNAGDVAALHKAVDDIHERYMDMFARG